MNIFVIILLTACTLLLLSLLNHNIQLKKEEKLFKPVGSMVEVNGHTKLN